MKKILVVCVAILIALTASNTPASALQTSIPCGWNATLENVARARGGNRHEGDLVISKPANWTYLGYSETYARDGRGVVVAVQFRAENGEVVIARYEEYKMQKCIPGVTGFWFQNIHIR